MINSGFVHNGEPVFHLGTEGEHSIRSWIKDYVSDGGAESEDLYPGKMFFDRYDCLMSASDDGKNILHITGSDFILIHCAEGWLFERVYDAFMHIGTGTEAKLNTVQYWYG